MKARAKGAKRYHGEGDGDSRRWTASRTERFPDLDTVQRPRAWIANISFQGSFEEAPTAERRARGTGFRTAAHLTAVCGTPHKPGLRGGRQLPPIDEAIDP